MTDKTKLTRRQQAVYDFILKSYADTGYFPSVREIRDAVGVSSTATIQAHLVSLVKKGYIARAGSGSRTLSILHREDLPAGVGGAGIEYDRGEVIDVPLVGRVAAGVPILAEENREDTIPLPASFIKGDSFMLRVRGDSMINAGILDGDLVVVRSQNTADNGDIVVALVGDVDGGDEPEATVKSFYKEKDAVRLQPENDHMEPIITRDVQVVGKVIALLRSVG